MQPAEGKERNGKGRETMRNKVNIKGLKVRELVAKKGNMSGEGRSAM